jgi:hypothetical protein
MKDILKALIIAFLLFIIPVIWNAISHGGVIRALGGLTPDDLNGIVVTLTSQEGSNRDITLARDSKSTTIYAQDNNSDDLHHRWQLRVLKK